MTRPRFFTPRAAILFGVSSLVLLAAFAPPGRASRAGAANAFRQTNLVSDLPGVALVQDPLLADPWGVARAPVRPFAVANRLTKSASLYRGGANNEPVTRNPDPPFLNVPNWAPTGVVANTGGEFVFMAECVVPPCPTGPAHYIFASIDGRILGWFPGLQHTARVVTTRPGHGWTGLTSGQSSGGTRLYAADFAGNHIDVFDGGFNVSSVPGNFADPSVPSGLHPYNIQNLGGALYVSYARYNVHSGLPDNAPGLGCVRKFDMDGVRDPAFAIDSGALDAPYGLAISPASFEPFDSALLVGNNSFRGRVNAYDFATGEFRGTLQDEAGRPVEIEYLTGLTFGGGLTGDPDTLYFAAGIGRRSHGLFGSLKPSTPATSTIRFAINPPEDAFHAWENAGHFDVTVLREGDTSGTVTVNYATADDRLNQVNDYTIALGKLTFAPGQTSKTFRVLITDDHEYAGGTRLPLDLILSNPTGAALGSPSVTELTIQDDEFDTPKFTNPIDDTTFFVRQHYHDFLNREPGGGLAFWTSNIEQCGASQGCREARRIDTSAAFFLSFEFQRTGLLAYLAHKAAFGARPLYGQFMRSTQALQRDYAFGAPGHEAQLEANKQEFFRDFVRAPEFVARHPASLTPEEFVDALYANAGVTPSAPERQQAVAEFGGSPDTSDLAARARALRRVAENLEFARAELNTAFVLMEYFGYLRRDPDEAGFNHWLSKLNAHGGDFRRAEMVKAFITSFEYRDRFKHN